MTALASASARATCRRNRKWSLAGVPERQWRVTRLTACSIQPTSLGILSCTRVPKAAAPGAGVRRMQSWSGEVIASEVCERLLGRVGDGEQGIELGQLEERPKILVEAGESKLSTKLADPLGERDQRSEPGRVDVSGAG